MQKPSRAIATALISTMPKRFTALVSVAVAVAFAAMPAPAFADVTDDPVLGDANVPGVVPPPGANTVPTWHDVITDPTNGATYGFDIVGKQDPRTSGVGTTTIPAEIIPINLSFAANGGRAFNGSDVTSAVVGSPIFQPGDYSAFSNNVGVQYGDAVMRSEFNQVGASPFHLRLQPTVLPTQNIDVPAPAGEVLTFRNGASLGCVAGVFMQTQLWKILNSLHISPTTLPILMTRDTFVGTTDAHGVCQPLAIGFHGAGDPGRSPWLGHSETVGQTYIEATYLTRPYFRASAAFPTPFRDIIVLTHEVSEWEHDPYLQNHPQPYGYNYTGTGAPRQCSNLLETGDPVIQYSTKLPGNSYFQDLPNNDGKWTIEDEVFIPWFARESPNLTSEPVASTGTGRYTFLGDLNPDAQFRTAATAC